MVDRVTAGQRIRDLRKSRGLTVEYCCMNTDISPTAWRSYERGDRTPRDEKKEAIASFFGKTINVIFFKE